MQPSRRQRCDRCTRPLSHCLCAHVHAVSHRTAVLVLQHPDEAQHPFNTARLAVLGLTNAQCWVGEVFDALPTRLAQAQRPALLFPGPGARLLRDDDTAALHVSGHGPLADGTPDLLVVPDGTWRQAGRLVRTNPVLLALPRLALPVAAPSRYRVRRASRPEAVSTLEAIVRSLALLEPAIDFLPVLRLFDVMVENQIRAMGPEAYARHCRLSAARHGTGGAD